MAGGSQGGRRGTMAGRPARKRVRKKSHTPKVNKVTGEPLQVVSPATIVREFSVEGFFLGAQGELRCRCSKKACYGDWDRDMVMRHINGVVHQRMMSTQVRISSSLEEATSAIGPRMDSSVVPMVPVVVAHGSLPEGVTAPTSSSGSAASAAVVASAGSNSSIASQRSLALRGSLRSGFNQYSPNNAPLTFQPRQSNMWARVETRNEDGTPGRPYWYDPRTGERAWAPPPPPVPTAAPHDARFIAGAHRVRRRKNTVDENGDGELKKSTHKKYLSTEQILREYPHDGFFVCEGSNALRCLCTKNSVGPWDRDMVRRHVTCGSHLKMKAKVVTIPVVGDQSVTIYLASLANRAVITSNFEPAPAVVVTAMPDDGSVVGTPQTAVLTQ